MHPNFQAAGDFFPGALILLRFLAGMMVGMFSAASAATLCA